MKSTILTKFIQKKGKNQSCTENEEKVNEGGMVIESFLCPNLLIFEYGALETPSSCFLVSL